MHDCSQSGFDVVRLVDLMQTYVCLVKLANICSLALTAASVEYTAKATQPDIFTGWRRRELQWSITFFWHPVQASFSHCPYRRRSEF